MTTASAPKNAAASIVAGFGWRIAGPAAARNSRTNEAWVAIATSSSAVTGAAAPDRRATRIDQRSAASHPRGEYPRKIRLCDQPPRVQKYSRTAVDTALRPESTFGCRSAHLERAGRATALGT